MADRVEKDPTTGKVSLHRLFDSLEVGTGAVEYTEGAWLYFALTDVRRPTVLRLQYVDLGSLAVLVERTFNAECSTPHDLVEYSLYTSRLPTPHPGVYAWELFAGDLGIGSSRLTVHYRPADNL